jgi:osomolarity two-component system sensor histidine kinase NIK1
MFSDRLILIIEDNQLNQKIISFWLAKINYSFIFASSGEEAVEIFKNQWFDVILMDIMLPGINGFETTYKIRNMGDKIYSKQPFIIALTANTLDNDRKRCLQAGMNEFLSKPFDIIQLNNILESIKYKNE